MDWISFGLILDFKKIRNEPACPVMGTISLVNIIEYVCRFYTLTLSDSNNP